MAGVAVAGVCVHRQVLAPAEHPLARDRVLVDRTARWRRSVRRSVAPKAELVAGLLVVVGVDALTAPGVVAALRRGRRAGRAQQQKRDAHGLVTGSRRLGSSPLEERKSYQYL